MNDYISKLRQIRMMKNFRSMYSLSCVLEITHANTEEGNYIFTKAYEMEPWLKLMQISENNLFRSVCLKDEYDAFAGCTVKKQYNDITVSDIVLYQLVDYLNKVPVEKQEIKEAIEQNACEGPSYFIQNLQSFQNDCDRWKDNIKALSEYNRLMYLDREILSLLKYIDSDASDYNYNSIYISIFGCAKDEMMESYNVFNYMNKRMLSKINSKFTKIVNKLREPNIKQEEVNSMNIALRSVDWKQSAIMGSYDHEATRRALAMVLPKYNSLV